MEDRSYNYIVEKFKEYEELKQQHDTLHSLGVPYSLTQYFVEHNSNLHDNADSGYSMGEIISVYCGEVLIAEYDHRKEYARSCKWRPRHGSVVFNFKTKKSLKDYCKALKELSGMRLSQDYFDKLVKVKEMLTKQIDVEASDISSRKSFDRVVFP